MPKNRRSTGEYSLMSLFHMDLVSFLPALAMGPIDNASTARRPQTLTHQKLDFDLTFPSCRKLTTWFVAGIHHVAAVERPQQIEETIIIRTDGSFVLSFEPTSESSTAIPRPFVALSVVRVAAMFEREPRRRPSSSADSDTRIFFRLGGGLGGRDRALRWEVRWRRPIPTWSRRRSTAGHRNLHELAQTAPIFG